MTSSEDKPAPATASLYRQVILTLKEADVPFLAGGAHALRKYAGIGRTTKDLDLFLRPSDLDRALEVLSQSGMQTEVRFPHWLAKAHAREGDIDLIFRSQNGLFEVDDRWFDRARVYELFGVAVNVCPPEEMIASKAFIMERERYDGSDVAHLFYSCAADLNWNRLLKLFDEHWRVLLSHLLLFGFIYPSERDRIPGWLMSDLMQRLQDEGQDSPPEQRLCQGTLLSQTQYMADVRQRGFQDARLQPLGNLTQGQVQRLQENVTDNEQP